MYFKNLCRTINAIGIHIEELLLPCRALKLNSELFLLYPSSYSYWSFAKNSLAFFPYMQLLSIILPTPEELNDGTRLCPCYSMNFSPKLATKQVSSIYSFIKEVSNNGMPVPLSQYENTDFWRKNLSFASIQTHAGFLWAQQISPASFLFLSDPTAVTDILLTHTARVPHTLLSSSLHFCTPAELRGNRAGQSYLDVCKAQSDSWDQTDWYCYCSSYVLNATSFPRIFHNYMWSGH